MAIAIDWRPGASGGSWRARVDYRDTDGRRRWRSVTVTAARYGGKKAAEREVRRQALELQRELDLAGGDVGGTNTLDVEGLARLWVLAASDSWVPARRKEVERHLRSYINPTIGAIRTHDLTVSHIDAVTRASATGISGQPLSGRSRRDIWTTLRALCRWGVQRGALEMDPCSRTKPPKADPVVHQVAPAASFPSIVAAVDELAPEWVAAGVRLALATGVRQGELVGLQWRDWDPATKTLRIERSGTRARGVRVGGKSSRVRVVPLGAKTAPWLGAWRVRLDEISVEFGLPRLGPNDPVITWVYARGPMRWRGQVAPEALGRWWTRNRADVAAACGVPVVAEVTWHELRHSMVTAAADGGAPLTSIGDLVGHTSAEVTEIYRHSTTEASRSAAEVVDGAF